MLFVDVEIAGEGGLKEVLDNQKQPLYIEKEETKLNENIDQKEAESSSQEVEKNEKAEESNEEPTSSIPENNSDFVADKNAESQQHLNEEKLVKENANEEAIPKIEEKKPKEKPTKETIKKKRDKKELMEVIRKAEKKKAKEKARKKLLEIAGQAAKKKKNEIFDKMLAGSIADMKKAIGRGKNGNGLGFSGSGSGVLTEGDYEVISSQIYPHWAVPSGIKDVENIIIEIRVQLKETGEVIPSSIKILDEKRYTTDYIFRAAADSARRAVLEASPLKIPRDKIKIFRDFILRFNLKEALGG
ncbi:MAG: hypothetical protein LBS23_02650 [Holosporaceae bacterium]|nr:hypothetical protein [Holosporaceae bacterium]